MFLHLPIHPSIHLPIHSFILHLPICSFISLSIHLPICSSISPSTIKAATVGLFAEREENVKADIFAAYNTLLRQTRPVSNQPLDADAMEEESRYGLPTLWNPPCLYCFDVFISFYEMCRVYKGSEMIGLLQLPLHLYLALCEYQKRKEQEKHK